MTTDRSGERTQVVIKSDIEMGILVRGAKDLPLGSRRYGYTIKGKRINKSPKLKALDYKLLGLDEEGIDVLFWHVQRGQNGEAIQLAGKVEKP